MKYEGGTQQCVPPSFFAIMISMIQSDIVKIKFYFPNASLAQKGKEAIVNTIARSIPNDKQIGFAGYLNRTDLCRDLHSFIFGTSKVINFPDLKNKRRKIRYVIRNSIKKCRTYTKIPPLNIFIFPTQVPGVLKEMGGVNGFTPYKNTIHIYMNPSVDPDWPKHLSSTVAHEIAHVLSREQFDWRTILDSFIFEGLAEHFREQVLGGGKASWVTAITKEKAITIIKKLEKDNLLRSTSNDLYLDLFYGGKRFTKWSGYTAGYLIIKTVLRVGKFKIKDLLREKPAKIFTLYKKTTQ